MAQISKVYRPKNQSIPAVGRLTGSSHLPKPKEAKMTKTDLVGRLVTLPGLTKIPRKELEWLVTNGTLEMLEAGTVVAPKGTRMGTLYIILSGHIAIRVDRGAGPRRVFEWRSGDISGMLPYSRMAGTPGDTYTEQFSELLSIHEKYFPEMINRCPVFTAHTVHIMLDRARSFNSSDLQDEKMISLGKLAAGLAHELNNPVSATVRCAKQLLVSLAEADAASRALGEAGLTGDLFDSIEQVLSACLVQSVGTILSPIQQVDREKEIGDWLARCKMDPAHAEPLAATPVTIQVLETMADMTSGYQLATALRWIVVRCAVHSLAVDIEHAATRMYELVAAVKKFTYMDSLAGPESVDVKTGLQDTIKIIGSKAKEKNAVITLEAESDLPRVIASGGELNQVWLNLIDNALDAIPQSGKIHIRTRREMDRVVIYVTNDGPGIPPDVLPRIFDPFFTTKPPGQGTGLGLEISRRLLRRYHGDISVQSRAGQTEFRVSLLLEKPELNKAG